MGEIFFVVLTVALLGGLLIWALRYSNWITDHTEDTVAALAKRDAALDELVGAPTTVLPSIPGPKPVAGWEWVGLQARDARSLIAPDPNGSYIVRINDDNSFSVHVNDVPDVPRDVPDVPTDVDHVDG